MQTTKEKAYKKIARLVEQFDEHIDEYKRGKYNEHQTRVDYINPFFNALGWDMDNKQGLAEAYREVIHEDKIKIGGSTKAPDYCFTVYGQRKFFVDAKKPSINIKGDIAPAYQVRRYGWSARLPVAIVTDFEEFSIYDCTKKPNQTDKASVSRIKYITYDNYLDEFDFFWDTFAKENILKGRFDKYVQSDAKKRGTANVDDEFLKSIEEWRTYLATTIALRNKSLSEDEINYAVQKNIDRIIFLRICEDRGIEHYGDLKNAIKKGDFYQNLFKLYRIADEKYNSGLFDFNEDTITPLLTVDNKVVKNIISDLYYPVSPYEFSVLPADILGSVYERFLGKTIRLTKAHHAKIEEKPEVRKAGGVYYTPKYIVDYIVENTVGKLIKDKKPKDIEKIKIVDPACGSGSFLIGAYQYLLNWHLQYYTENPPQKKKDNPLTPDGNLTTAEKKRILLNNIYGVDIDAQAVEVTKLNLLLKALEGETNASISKQLTFFNERVLPNLGDNIKCGNSLIGTDFYDDQLVLFPEQIKKINAFDWDKAFPEIFKNGGFDVVIGNPPYFSLSTLEQSQQVYYSNKYYNSDKSADIYCLFFEKSIKILQKKGLLSFITSNQWLQTNYGKTLKKFFIQYSNPELLINFGGFKIFQDATVDTSIVVLSKQPCQFNLKAVHCKKDFNKLSILDEYLNNNKVILKNLNDENWIIADNNTIQLKEKIKQKGTFLKEMNIKIHRGLLTGLNDAFIINNETKERICKEFDRSSEILVPIIRGRDVHKFYNNWAGFWLVLTKNGVDIKKYPLIYKHLESFGNKIRNRADQGENWWNLRACAYYDDFEKDKIIYPETTVRRSEFYLDSNKMFIDKTCFMITGEDLAYLNGILASSLMEWYLESELRLLGKRSIQYSKQYIENIPIPKINFLNPKEKQTHDTIVNLVDNLLNLNKELQSTKLDTHRRQLQRAIDHAENKIDKLVYKLYGLTEEEIGIVENG